MSKQNKLEGLLTENDINKLIADNNLIIRPLLNEDQVGQISIDLRVGTNFLTSQQGREPFIDATKNQFESRPIKSFFSETRRHLGEPFLIHPNQTILFSSLEYLKLPSNVYGIISCRSSYSRLGLTISTFVQPGYCGCLSVEMLYSGNSPIKILSGTRLIQIRLYKLKNSTNYLNSQRKYICQVRPIPSKANEDTDLITLNKIAKKYD